MRPELTVQSSSLLSPSKSSCTAHQGEAQLLQERSVSEEALKDGPPPGMPPLCSQLEDFAPSCALMSVVYGGHQCLKNLAALFCSLKAHRAVYETLVEPSCLGSTTWLSSSQSAPSKGATCKIRSCPCSVPECALVTDQHGLGEGGPAFPKERPEAVSGVAVAGAGA